MKDVQVRKIDFSRKRIANLADKYYNEGNFLSALRFAYRELHTYGGDPDVFARLSDIYEGMGLHGSAINCWFRFLDIAEDEDFADIYEGLAVNFLALGNESQSAYYYNQLIDADDSLPEETKFDIAEAFSVAKKDKFRFVYPPQLADYSKELSLGSKALKMGDCKKAVAEFAKVEKGSPEYPAAKEMQAIAYLLARQTAEAEKACREILEIKPDEVRAQATLAAVYLEQGRNEESRALALALAAQEQEESDDLYKVATVCCENGLHEEAYRKFQKLEEKMPYDGRMLYFKAVAAYKCGRLTEAERALDTLCTVYPDAEVAKYYLKRLREYLEAVKAGEEATPPELIYFYHLPQEEREHRCSSLLKIGDCPKDEAKIFGLLALHDGYFHWCFDEMDGGDHDLQYLGLVTALHVHADEFVQEVLLDYEVMDVLKVEALRLLLERNEDQEVGVVLYSIYRSVTLFKIHIGRKRRKKFIAGYAKVASKFAIIKDLYAEKLADAAEELYNALEFCGSLDMIDNPDDCACAIYLLAGLKELGKDVHFIAQAFDADPSKVQALMTTALSARFGAQEELAVAKRQENEDKADEAD